MTDDGPPKQISTKFTKADLGYSTELARDILRKISDRLTVWLLAGNAAGLLFCMNTIVQRDICDWGLFRSTAMIFGSGAIAVFVAQVGSAMSYSAYSVTEVYVAKNEALHDPSEQRIFRRTLKLIQALGSTTSAISGCAFIISFVCLIWAPFSFITNPNAAAVFCGR